MLLINPFAWIVAVCVVAVYAAMLNRYAVDFPSADDFVQILAVPQYVGYAQTLQAKLKEIFSLAVEHRIVTLRLAALFQANALGGLDFRMLLYYGSALVILAGLLVVSRFDRSIRPLAAAVAAALLLSPAGFEATFWPTGALQHLGGVAYAIVALYCLSRLGVAWQLLAAAAALASAFTSAGGLMVFPSAVVLLLFQRRWRSAFVWAVGGATLFAVYFIGYEAPPYQGTVQTYLHDPLILVRFFATSLGALGRDASVALGVGIAIGAFWGWLVVSGRIKSVPPVVVGWMLFVALSFAAITWGRANFGISGALLSRYRVYADFAALITLIALLSQVSRETGVRVMVIALPVSVGLFLVSWRYDLPALEWFAIDRRNQLDYYVAEGHSLPMPTPPVEYRDFLLDAGRQRGFYLPTGAKPPRHFRVEDIPLDTTNAPRAVVEPPVIGKRVALIRVYAPGYEDEAFLWLKSDDRQYRGTLDRMPRAPLAFGFRTGFLWGLYALDGISPGKYRIGVMAGDRASPSVAWSNEWITVEAD